MVFMEGALEGCLLLTLSRTLASSFACGDVAKGRAGLKGVEDGSEQTFRLSPVGRTLVDGINEIMFESHRLFPHGGCDVRIGPVRALGSETRIRAMSSVLSSKGGAPATFHGTVGIRERQSPRQPHVESIDTVCRMPALWLRELQSRNKKGGLAVVIIRL